MLRRYLKYSFTRVDPTTLFLEQIILWEYPEDAVRDLNAATKITTLTYNQYGIVHEAIDDSVAGTEEVISRSDVPLDQLGTGTGVRRLVEGRAVEPRGLLVRRHFRTGEEVSTADVENVVTAPSQG